MVRYESGSCSLNSDLSRCYEQAAHRYAKEHGGRVEWMDEYNDYSVRGRWVVRVAS